MLIDGDHKPNGIPPSVQCEEMPEAVKKQLETICYQTTVVLRGIWKASEFENAQKENLIVGHEKYVLKFEKGQVRTDGRILLYVFSISKLGNSAIEEGHWELILSDDEYQKLCEGKLILDATAENQMWYVGRYDMLRPLRSYIHPTATLTCGITMHPLISNATNPDYADPVEQYYDLVHEAVEKLGLTIAKTEKGRTGNQTIRLFRDMDDQKLLLAYGMKISNWHELCENPGKDFEDIAKNNILQFIGYEGRRAISDKLSFQEWARVIEATMANGKDDLADLGEHVKSFFRMYPKLPVIEEQDETPEEDSRPWWAILIDELVKLEYGNGYVRMNTV